VIRTTRLLLREWREEDREPWAAMNADPAVMAYFPSTLDRAESDAAFDRLSAGVSERGWGLWAAEHEGAFIGFTGLSPVPDDLPFAPAIEIGWRLTRSAWGHGFATEAARAALEFAFVQLEASAVVSFTATGNLRSRAVMERLGMHRDDAGDFDHPRVPVGSAVRRHVLYRVARSELEPFVETGESSRGGR
jgi:RimJ/RimL family protein N-acetyltransferase